MIEGCVVAIYPLHTQLLTDIARVYSSSTTGILLNLRTPTSASNKKEGVEHIGVLPQPAGLDTRLLINLCPLFSSASRVDVPGERQTTCTKKPTQYEKGYTFRKDDV
jgi:hypothetical protein